MRGWVAIVWSWTAHRGVIKKRSVPEKISSVSDCVHMSLTAFRVLSYRITDIVTTMLGISIVDMGVLGCVISVLTITACHRARLPAHGLTCGINV